MNGLHDADNKFVAALDLEVFLGVLWMGPNAGHVRQHRVIQRLHWCQTGDHHMVTNGLMLLGTCIASCTA